MNESPASSPPTSAAASSPSSPASARTTPISRDLLVLSLALTALLLPAMFATELTTTDEARYTQVAREMRLAGEWVSPKLNSREYWEKPALFFDLLQLPQRVTGRVTAVGSRLMILPFALATLLLTFACAQLLAGRRAARLAAIVLATSTLFFEYSHMAVLDIPMLAFITAAFLAYLVWTRTGAPPLRWQFVCAIAMGLGCHFKGPVAILLPGMVMAIDGVLRRKARAFASPAAYWMPVVALLVLGLWVVPMALIHGDPFVAKMFGKHIAERSASAEAPHARPFHYYIPQVLVAVLPWAFLIPAAFVTTRRAGLSAANATGEAVRAQENPLRFPFIWCITIPIVLSFISSKRTQYLLPAVPGFAVWMGIALDRWIAEGPPAGRVWRATVVAVRGFAVLLTVVGVSIALVGIIERVGPGTIPAPEKAGVAWGAAIERGWLVQVGSIGAACFLIVSALARKGTAVRLVLALALLGVSANLLRSTAIEGFRDEFIRPNEFGAELGVLIENDGEVAIYAMGLNGTYLLHSGATRFETVVFPEDTLEFLDRPGPHGVIGKRRYLERYIWPEFGDREILVLATHREGRSQVVLYGNAAALERWRTLHPGAEPETHRASEFRAPEPAATEE